MIERYVGISDKGNLMKHMYLALAALLVMVTAEAVRPADKAAQPTPREALQKFQDQIGSWRGTGQPEGSREEKQRGFWQEFLEALDRVANIRHA